MLILYVGPEIKGSKLEQMRKKALLTADSAKALSEENEKQVDSQSSEAIKKGKAKKSS